MINTLKLGISYKSIAKTVENLAPKKEYHDELIGFAYLVDNLESTINLFCSLAKKSTRGENRSTILYIIDCIYDDLNSHCFEIYDDDYIVVSRLINDKFLDVMATTRSKPFFKLGEKLILLLKEYDAKYLELKKVAK